MRRLRILALLTAVLLAVPGFGMAQTETPEMRIDISGGEVLPGLAAVITVIAPEDGTCSIGILDADGQQIAVRQDTTPFTGTVPGTGSRFRRGSGAWQWR